MSDLEGVTRRIAEIVSDWTRRAHQLRADALPSVLAARIVEVEIKPLVEALEEVRQSPAVDEIIRKYARIDKLRGTAMVSTDTSWLFSPGFGQPWEG